MCWVIQQVFLRGLPFKAAFNIPTVWDYFTDVNQLHFKMRVLYLLCIFRSRCCYTCEQSQVF